jgi:hypothetical protein
MYISRNTEKAELCENDFVLLFFEWKGNDEHRKEYQREYGIALFTEKLELLGDFHRGKRFIKTSTWFGVFNF